jgi:hypothetical protein
MGAMDELMQRHGSHLGLGSTHVEGKGKTYLIVPSTMIENRAPGLEQGV